MDIAAPCISNVFEQRSGHVSFASSGGFKKATAVSRKDVLHAARPKETEKTAVAPTSAELPVSPINKGDTTSAESRMRVIMAAETRKCQDEVVGDTTSDMIISAEDVMDEFLQDDDMIQLEEICEKLQGLDDEEIEDLRKICPEMADNLASGQEHVNEFITYRRQMHEKRERQLHARKSFVQFKVESDSKKASEVEADNAESTQTPSPKNSDSDVHKHSHAERSRKSSAMSFRTLGVVAKASGRFKSNLSRTGARITSQDSGSPRARGEAKKKFSSCPPLTGGD